MSIGRAEPETFDSDEDRLDQYKRDVADDASVTLEIRAHANSDMRFGAIPGGQWEDHFLDDEDCNRAKLEMDRVSPYLYRFLGKWNQNRVGVEFKPNDAGTTTEDSDLINGMYRANYRQFSGRVATDNAVQEAATCGVGAFKLATCFEDEGDVENENMNVEWRPIYNAFDTVVWDQAALRIDKRDARHVTELKQFTRKSFEKEYPGLSAVSAYEPSGRLLNINHFERIDIVYVATRYEIVKRKEKFHVYNNLQTGVVEIYSDSDHELIKDELRDSDFHIKVRTRKKTVQTVEKTVFSGADILDRTRRIAGKWLPIIPVYAYRQYIDGIEQYWGLVRKLKDPQRLLNTQISQYGENAASTGQDIPIFDPSQMLGPEMERIWSDRNNQPYLLANALRDKNDNVIHPGPIGQLKPAQLDGSSVALMNFIPQHIEDITGVQPAEAFSKEMSGKAIKLLLKREDLNTQVIMENIANAIEWSGTVYQEIAAEVYTTPRMVKTISRDGTENNVRMFEVITDQETMVQVQINTLGGKRFQAYADVGPSYDTLREQEVEDSKGMIDLFLQIPSAQIYVDAMVSLMASSATGVNMGPIKEIAHRKMLVDGTIKPKTPEEQQLVQEAQSAQGEPDAQAKVLDAVANEQNAAARLADSKSLVNIADATKKSAETLKIESETGKIETSTELEVAEFIQESRRLAKQGL